MRNQIVLDAHILDTLYTESKVLSVIEQTMKYLFEYPERINIDYLVLSR